MGARKELDRAAGRRSLVAASARRVMRRFGVGGSDHLTYPAPERFVEAFDGATLRSHLALRSPLGATQALSLFINIPPQRRVDAANRWGAGRTCSAEPIDAYLGLIYRELDLLMGPLGDRRAVNQVWIAGGAGRLFPGESLPQLMSELRSRFELSRNGDFGIDVDPAAVSIADIATIAQLGFNRIDLGQVGFDQRTEHQPPDSSVPFQPDRTRQSGRAATEDFARVITAARQVGVRSVATALHYGVPAQSVAAFDRALCELIGLNPDRIVLRHYSYRLPGMPRIDRRADLPDLATCVDMLIHGRSLLHAAGYVEIGLEQFVRRDDDLDQVARRGLLLRSLLGFSRLPEFDRLGVGLGAISRIGGIYAQNMVYLEDYESCLSQQVLPVMRGIELTRDDLVRGAVISALIGRGEVSIESIAIAHLISFSDHFSREMEKLAVMEEAGLVELSPDWISVTPQGRLVVRAICALFDRHASRALERRALTELN